ncbi:MAG: purine-binding chemotaxis protein CheW [Firmicutes bacterium]|nr:purine-binding chemotaxis protein CheW [Bacillota bacterium]
MGTDNQIVVMGLNNQKYALPINSVSEIIRVMEVTQVPNMQDYCTGIINLRGSVVPVVSMGLRLGLGESEATRDSRIIVVEQNNQKLGLTVDSVYSVSEFSQEQIEEPEALGGTERFIKGVIHQNNDMVLLLDLGKIASN